MSKSLFLFDIDGTLTEPRLPIKDDMRKFLSYLKSYGDIAIVGGSDYQKAKEQLGETILEDFKYCFFENGLNSYMEGNRFHTASISKYIDNDKLKDFINFCLLYIAELDIPIKRGTFIEFRNGMINISPIGRNCSHDERIEFNKFDDEHHIREKFVETLKEKFKDLDLTYSIGGQISFDVFPRGWDKTYCLNLLPNDEYDNIYFFGDKTDPGGNDHELYISPLVRGHKVRNPDDTKDQVSKYIV